MKKTHFLLAIFMLTSSLLVTACSRSSDNPADPADSGGGTATGSGTMSATVDGQSWTVTSGAVLATYTPTVEGNALAVIGSQVQGTSTSTLTITIENVRGTGEFRLGLPGVGGAQGSAGYGIATSAGAGGNVQVWVTTNTETGTVNITRLDVPNKTVAGTFSFRCRNTNATPEIRNITNGRFEARWP
jgi:hypothetical protein